MAPKSYGGVRLGQITSSARAGTIQPSPSLYPFVVSGMPCSVLQACLAAVICASLKPARNLHQRNLAFLLMPRPVKVRSTSLTLMAEPPVEAVAAPAAAAAGCRPRHWRWGLRSCACMFCGVDVGCCAAWAALASCWGCAGAERAAQAGSMAWRRSVVCKLFWAIDCHSIAIRRVAVPAARAEDGNR